MSSFIIAFIFFVAPKPPLGQSLFRVEVSRSHSDTPHSIDSSGRVISPTQRPLPDNTQHSQEIGTLPKGGIRTRNPRNWAATDPLLRRRGYWVHNEVTAMCCGICIADTNVPEIKRRNCCTCLQNYTASVMRNSNFSIHCLYNPKSQFVAQIRVQTLKPNKTAHFVSQVSNILKQGSIIKIYLVTSWIFRVEDGQIIFLHNVGIRLQGYIAL
jgi:hypothetical protein